MSGPDGLFETLVDIMRPIDHEFSVCQFFADDSYDYVARFVGAEEAVKLVRHYTDNVAVEMGITKRVIVTDGGDCVVFEWIAGKGVTYPPAATVKS